MHRFFICNFLFNFLLLFKIRTIWNCVIKKSLFLQYYRLFSKNALTLLFEIVWLIFEITIPSLILQFILLWMNTFSFFGLFSLNESLLTLKTSFTWIHLSWSKCRRFMTVAMSQYFLWIFSVINIISGISSTMHLIYN